MPMFAGVLESCWRCPGVLRRANSLEKSFEKPPQKHLKNLPKNTKKKTPKTSKIHPQHDSNLKSIKKPKIGGLWDPLGVSLERLGGVLGRLWDRLGGVLGRLGGVLGRLGRVLGASWRVLARLGRVLARLGRDFDAACRHLGRS